MSGERFTLRRGSWERLGLQRERSPSARTTGCLIDARPGR